MILLIGVINSSASFDVNGWNFTYGRGSSRTAVILRKFATSSGTNDYTWSGWNSSQVRVTTVTLRSTDEYNITRNYSGEDISSANLAGEWGNSGVAFIAAADTTGLTHTTPSPSYFGFASPEITGYSGPHTDPTDGYSVSFNSSNNAIASIVVQSSNNTTPSLPVLTNPETARYQGAFNLGWTFNDADEDDSQSSYYLRIKRRP
ncbi:MAG: hypothetical protein WD467_00255 [Candidatus Saccharimonadales bacterium]